MQQVRRAFVMATLGQYLRLVIGFAMIAAVSRLMTPAEVGLSAIGLGVSMIVFSLREFVSCDFLIQLDRVEREDVRTAMTVMVGFTITLSLALLITSPWITHFYGEIELQDFLLVAIAAALAECISLPHISLLRRDMQFGMVTLVDTARTTAAAVATILFAWYGWSAMSFAIGSLIGSVAATGLAIFLRQCWWSFKPSLRSLPAIIEFGRYRGATSVADRAYDSLPPIILGAVMPSAGVGSYNRAIAVSNLPDRLILGSVFAVSFPALSAGVRAGLDLRKSYLRALSFITVIYWPALVLVAILVRPIVDLVLGGNWDDVVPIARILTLASIFWFPVILTSPLLIALGANRSAFLYNAVSRAISAVILGIASVFGLMAVALSQFITLPFQSVLAVLFVRRYVTFGWRDMWNAVLPSALVTLASAVGPLAIAADNGFTFEFSPGEAAISVGLAIVGWFAGLKLTGHPFLNEITGFMGDSLRGMRLGTRGHASAE